MTRTVARGARSDADDETALTTELHAMLTTLVARGPLFADLRRQGVAEDLVQDTLVTVTQRMRRGHVIQDPFAYAAKCVTNLAKRTYLRNARELATSDDRLERLGPHVEDVADRVHQRMTIGEVLEMVRSVNTVIAALDSVELELVKAELARTDQKDLAARLGISRPTLYRRKGPAIAAFVAAVAQRAGTTPCPEHAGALLAAAGDSGFGAARAALAHAEHCDRCRLTIRHLTVARHGLPIIAPVPLLLEQPEPAGAVDRAVAAVQSFGDWIRSLVLRSGDPTPFAGSTGKTVAILAAACTGGGGVYCVVQGIPAPLKAPFVHGAAKPPRARAPALRRAPTTAGTVLPAGQIIGQAVNAARITERREAQQVTATRRRNGKARLKARVKARILAQRRQQTARELARRAGSPPSTRPEFTRPPPSPATTITRREFASPTLAQREFGAP